MGFVQLTHILPIILTQDMAESLNNKAVFGTQASIH